MQILLASLLLIVAIVLFLAKNAITNEALERATNIASVITGVAGIIIFAFYTASVRSESVGFDPSLSVSPTIAPLNSVTPAPFQSITQIPSETASPTETSTPTETLAVPTPTLTATVTLTPLITLPFRDDFSKGINPPWRMYSGTWITTDNGATISINENDNPAGALILDDPTLTNYRLRVDVYSPDVLSANQGDLGVVVRYGSNRDQNLIYYMNSSSRFRWGYTPTLSELPFHLPEITGNDEANIISRFTFEIDVSGNTFIAKVNGAKYDQFTMSGYETGGIALVTSCGAIGSCPSFSNFSLEPLP